MGGCCSKVGLQTANTIITSNNVTLLTIAQNDFRAKRASLLTDLVEDKTDDTLTKTSPGRVKWKLGDQIGEGTYGDVYQGLNIDTGELLAVKRIRLDGGRPGLPEITSTLEKLKREVKLLKELSHPNIVRYIQTDLAEGGAAVDIVMECVSGGSIRSLVKKYEGLDETVIRPYTEQILHGLVHLHEHRIIHRDLKGANILITSDGIVKLTDFGSAGTLRDIHSNSTDMCLSMKGSPYWMAPEIVLREGHTTKADIWSLGCVLIEMRRGTPPWSDESKETKGVLKLIATPGSNPNTDIPALPACSPQLYDLIMQCLVRNPQGRPEAKDLLQHAFITGKPLRLGD